MRYMTKDQMEKLQKEIDKLSKEIENLKQKTTKQLWLDDLN